MIDVVFINLILYFMFLWVGLGNPGNEYKSTRHNIGVFVLQKIFMEYKIKKQKKFFSIEYIQDIIPNVKLIFPQTYMNLSGNAVLKASHFYKIKIENIVIFHDEIDLAVGEVKYKFGGGHNGHNGIRDIIAKTGRSDFHRIRLGVGRPQNQNQPVADFLLEQTSLENMIDTQKVLKILEENELMLI